MSSFSWSPVEGGGGGGGGGVTAVNSLSGSLTLAVSNGLSVASGGSTITISGVNATGVLPGVVSTAAQTFAGAKTFSSAPILSSLTVSRALTLDGTGTVAVSATTATELGYVSGVTSAIQTQLNTKAPTASPTFTGTVTGPFGLGVITSSAGGALSSTSLLTIARGGTNSGTALNNNRVMQSSSGAIVEAAAIAASRALASDANGIPVAATTTTTELNFVSGVTSAIQTQLNAKAPTASPTFTGTVTTPLTTAGPVITSAGGVLSSEATLAVARGGTNSGTVLSNNRVMRSSAGAIVEAAAITASRALASDANGIPVAATTTTTELNFVNGVTSAIQTQLNARVTAATYTAKGSILAATAASTPANLAVGTNGQVLRANSATATGLEWGTGGANLVVVSKTTTFTALITEDVYLCSTSGGIYTVTLPTPVGNSGKVFDFKKTTSDFNAMTISGTGLSTTINTLNEQLQIVSDGTNWVIVERYIPNVLTAYTPTGSWTINSPTYTGFWARRGDSVYCEIKFTAGGAVNNVELTVTLPSGLTIDTAKLTNATFTSNNYGPATILDSGTAVFSGFVTYSTTTDVLIRVLGAAGTYVNTATMSATVPMTWASGDTVVASWTLPISGWNG